MANIAPALDVAAHPRRAGRFAEPRRRRVCFCRRLRAPQPPRGEARRSGEPDRPIEKVLCEYARFIALVAAKLIGAGRQPSLGSQRADSGIQRGRVIGPNPSVVRRHCVPHEGKARSCAFLSQIGRPQARVSGAVQGRLRAHAHAVDRHESGLWHSRPDAARSSFETL